MTILNTKEIDDYFNVQALSCSFLKNFSKAPAYAFVEKDSKALRDGRMIHEHILEYEEFLKHYAYNPHDGRTKAGREFALKNNHKTIISSSEAENLFRMKATLILSMSPLGITMNDIIEEGVKEQGIYAEVSLSGIENIAVKVKPDIVLIRDKIYIFDIKTCNDVNDFYYDAKKYKYDWQSELYKKIVSNHYPGNEVSFIFVCIEKKEPYGVKFYEIESDCFSWIESTIYNYHTWELNGGDKSDLYPPNLNRVEIRR